jgi:hypothetical protein
MITLLDVFRDLTYGELSQLHIGGLIPSELESEPDPANYTKIISHVNMGMTELYKRFFLLSREIYIQQYEEIELYQLHSNFNQTNVASTEPIKYILDTPDNPFLDDLLKIEQVYDEVGCLLPLNDISEEFSVFTPSYRSVQIPYPKNENVFAVQYRADHPRIVWDQETMPIDIEIDIPQSLYEALLFYVGSRAHTSMGGDGGAEGGMYWQKFNQSCEDVMRLGLQVQGEPGAWRFDQAGWV